jgi:probable rRNA maturation factor
MIVNRQHSIRIAAKDLNQFVVRARRALRLPSESISICLVSNSEMERWNRAYRGKKGPTDVLSFPADANKGPRVRKNSRSRRDADLFLIAPHSNGRWRYLGDIAIAPAVAKRNALRFRRTFREEMRILILHGMLHLMGYDHETDTGQMDRRERRLRRELGLD